MVITPSDVAAEMRQALANLRAALAESGLEITDILKTTIYVATSDRQDLLAAWNEVTTAFGKHDVPSTLLGVAVLGYADQLGEIEAVAAARRRSSDQ